MKITKLWTNVNGKKIPLELMDDYYLKNAYIRCAEIILAEKSKQSSGINSIMKSNLLTIDDANKWEVEFKKEIKKRKLKIPDISFIDIEYKKKQERKIKKLENNKKFDERFK